MSGHADELGLAAACLEGDPDALARFEHEHLAPVAATLRRAGYDRTLVDETIQLVRYRLLVATPERPAKLATYRGLGSLRGWLRVTALRQARALLGPRPVTLASERDPAADPAQLEAALLARDHGADLRRIVRAAIASLDEPARHALRLEVVDGLPHHEIAALHHVHRTTIVRWIEDARATIAAAVRRGLRHELGLGPATVDSFLRSLAGLELSLASALRAG